MDLKPTKNRIFCSLIASVPISLLFFIFKMEVAKSYAGYLSPEEFHLYYIVPIISFLTTYFFVCWFITRKGDSNPIEPYK